MLLFADAGPAGTGLARVVPAGTQISEAVPAGAGLARAVTAGMQISDPVSLK